MLHIAIDIHLDIPEQEVEKLVNDLKITTSRLLRTDDAKVHMTYRQNIENIQDVNHKG